MINNNLSEHTCKSCGNNFLGLYCNLCGEKVIEPTDRKFSNFLNTVLISTTVLDNKFIKSLWLIIMNPGFLSSEYVNGRRIRYMRPLQVFFILNLVYFLFPVLQMFNATLQTQLHVLPHQLAQRIVVDKINQESMNLRAFEMIYDNKTTELAKLLVVIFIILASIPLSLIFSKKNRFFTDHVALAVELTSFNLAVNAILLNVVFAVLNKGMNMVSWGVDYLNETTITIVFVGTNLYFIFNAAQTFYGQSGKRLFIKAIIGILGLFLALEAYRVILFFITIWSL